MAEPSIKTTPPTVNPISPPLPTNSPSTNTTLFSSLSSLPDVTLPEISLPTVPDIPQTLRLIRKILPFLALIPVCLEIYYTAQKFSFHVQSWIPKANLIITIIAFLAHVRTLYLQAVNKKDTGNVYLISIPANLYLVIGNIFFFVESSGPMGGYSRWLSYMGPVIVEMVVGSISVFEALYAIRVWHRFLKENGMLYKEDKSKDAIALETMEQGRQRDQARLETKLEQAMELIQSQQTQLQQLVHVQQGGTVGMAVATAATLASAAAGERDPSALVFDESLRVLSEMGHKLEIVDENLSDRDQNYQNHNNNSNQGGPSSSSAFISRSHSGAPQFIQSDSVQDSNNDTRAPPPPQYSTEPSSSFTIPAPETPHRKH